MANYQYSAKDKNGASRTGVIEAVSEIEAAGILHKKELIVVNLKETKAKKGISEEKGKSAKVRTEDLVVFSRQLATLIDAGVPLVQSLSILSEQLKNKNLRFVTSMLRQDIEGGINFCDALTKHPAIFSDLFINMVRAGEASGTLNSVLDRLSIYMEKAASLARKVKSSLVYPTVVISMAMIITVFLLVKVVPTFKGIFETLGGVLPFPTRVLISISDVLKQYFLYLTGIFIILIFLFKKYISTEKGRYNFDSFKLDVWVFGELIRKVAVAKFSRTFSTLIKSGVPMLTALDIVAKTSGNKVIEGVIFGCRKAVREGEPLSSPLSKSKVFPPMVTQMIGIGEKTGQLDKMLTKVSDFYEDEVDAAVSGLTSMIEPMVIAFLGIIVGGIVIALFLPIFKITELVS